VLPGPLASQTTSSDCTTRPALPDSILTYWEVALPGAGGIAVGRHRISFPQNGFGARSEWRRRVHELRCFG
jgi:hypothetical protein